jgi:uncharacterized protein YdhG (YjbR/CyaY superfamily)
MTNYSVKNVDEFIKATRKEARAHLKEIRAAVKSALPKAEERIGWGKPFYYYNGWIAGFDVYKNHVGFEIFASRLPNEIRKELEEKGYKTGNKTVQIGYYQKVPTLLIKKLLKTRAKMNEVKVKSNKK